MAIYRREFIKIAGFGAIGAATVSVSDLLARVKLPQESPLTAHRWAMVIDLEKCREQSGCAKCIDACHKGHNVPHFENKKDEVKWIWKESFVHTFHDQEHEYLDESLKHGTVPVFCNHCDDPPCVKVCPTGATWKREKDGVVMMDWHRCIGCRYCMAACPYGSRSFNWRDPRSFVDKLNPEYPTRTRGVVEKCTFCEERLAVGKLPACVEACPVDAMTFGDVEDPNSDVRQILGNQFSIRRKAALGTQPQIYYLV